MVTDYLYNRSFKCLLADFDTTTCLFKGAYAYLNAGLKQGDTVYIIDAIKNGKDPLYMYSEKDKKFIVQAQ